MSGETCPRCGKDPIEGCSGRGFIILDDETTKTCPHVLVQRFYAKWKRTLGNAAQAMIEIPPDQRLRGSPLYVPGETDLTKHNVFIKGACWLRFLNHLRWVLLVKGIDYHAGFTTDTQILSVFLGKEKVSAVVALEAIDESKAKTKEREARSVNNSLYDLASGPDLLIVRLGMLGHKNIAAAGVLLETLRIRQQVHRPTWLVEMAGKPFNQCHSYDEEVGAMANSFVQMKLGDDAYDPYTMTYDMAPDDMTEGEELLGTLGSSKPDMSEEAPEEPEETPEEEPVERPSYETGEILLPGMGAGSERYGKKKSKKYGGGYHS